MIQPFSITLKVADMKSRQASSLWKSGYFSTLKFASGHMMINTMLH